MDGKLGMVNGREIMEEKYGKWKVEKGEIDGWE